jgi:hypothetical protein
VGACRGFSLPRSRSLPLVQGSSRQGPCFHRALGYFLSDERFSRHSRLIAFATGWLYCLLLTALLVIGLPRFSTS